MKSREEQIKKFLSDEKKLKALVNDEAFIDKVSGGCATPEAYQEELKKFGLEISEDEAKQIEDTVNKIFETPTEQLDDDFLKNIAGGVVSNDNTAINNENENVRAPSSSRGLPTGAVVGLAVGIPVAAWLGSGIGCAIAASVYRKKKNKDKFHKCATAAFHIFNTPFLPIEAIGVLAMAPELNQRDFKDLGVLFTHPVESIFGLDDEED